MKQDNQREDELKDTNEHSNHDIREEKIESFHLTNPGEDIACLIPVKERSRLRRCWKRFFLRLVKASWPKIPKR
ncbi:MAG: hypothetical protein PHQ48_05835 [Acidobacteriota bacterium]|nr:hypothetical protein [Acidobacteriota bacterium]